MKKALLCVMIIIVIVVLGSFAIKEWKKRTEVGIPQPYIPKEGEEYTLVVYAGYILSLIHI